MACAEDEAPDDVVWKGTPRARLMMAGVDDVVDITDMPMYADGSFDFFICSHVLRHVSSTSPATVDGLNHCDLDGRVGSRRFSNWNLSDSPNPSSRLKSIGQKFGFAGQASPSATGLRRLSDTTHFPCLGAAAASADLLMFTGLGHDIVPRGFEPKVSPSHKVWQIAAVVVVRSLLARVYTMC
jgi:hypothetical protein